MRRSTIGRPRKLTDDQVAAILAWYEAHQALMILRRYLRPVQQLARDLGIAPATVYNVVSRQGVYKKRGPTAQR
jgi:transposase